jgi:hypothetical protein
MEFDAHVPPGCYIVGSKKGDYNLHPTMVIVPCDKTVCVNLIEEGDYDTVALAPEVATGNESTGDKVQL